ncbi:MAG: hypothetical protein MJK04_33570, partial [Psychrosphaera sp.]|nr:hypothetical protein [Psychrosphaera sp.]
KQTEINALIAAFTAENPGVLAIAWCLKECSSDVEKLKLLITLVKSSLAKSISFATLSGLVAGKENVLRDLLSDVLVSQIPQLPELIEKATLASLVEIFTKTSKNLVMTKALLSVVKAGDEQLLEAFVKTWKSASITDLHPLLLRFGLADLTELKKQGNEEKLTKLFITDALSAVETKLLLTKSCSNKVVEFLEKVPKPDLLIKLEVLAGSVNELDRMLTELKTDGTKISPVETSMNGGSPADTMAKVAVAGDITMRSTPKGKVTPTSGPELNNEHKYGDSRAKHTKLGLYSVDDIAVAVLTKVGNAMYGSQLGKPATDGYSNLVQDALENGHRVSYQEYTHTAGYDTGVNIMTGGKTKNYSMYKSFDYGGWHVFPG